MVQNGVVVMGKQNLTRKQQVNLIKGGGSGLSLWKKDFELGVGGGGQDTSRHFEGGFGSMCAILLTEASEQKIGPKTKIELKEIELRYCQHSMCLKKTSI